MSDLTSKTGPESVRDLKIQMASAAIEKLVDRIESIERQVIELRHEIATDAAVRAAAEKAEAKAEEKLTRLQKLRPFGIAAGGGSVLIGIWEGVRALWEYIQKGGGG